MRKQLFVSLLLALAAPCASFSAFAAPEPQQQGQAATVIRGTVLDENNEPLIGVSVVQKGVNTNAVTTDIDGKFAIRVKPGTTLAISYVGYTSKEVAASNGMTVKLEPNSTNLNEVVVTALGIKKDRKALGYSVSEMSSEEILENKSPNVVNALAGKVAGVTVTQYSGAAGAGANITLRGGNSSSEGRTNEPLFVVDGIIYDNSTQVVGNSGTDGMTRSNTTYSNRVMDINPEDIESMSILKGAAASALYG
ncbi:MAG: TonB-dependent receptor, partial [Muribaculaceae bacterium]|nr:TonB-dependent receptor [Muribaculaceae bacterium]